MRSLKLPKKTNDKEWKLIEYTQWLGRDLSFQNLDKELADIEEKYTAPNGELLVAIDDNDVVLGMVAYYHNLMNDVIYMSKELVD